MTKNISLLINILENYIENITLILHKYWCIFFCWIFPRIAILMTLKYECMTKSYGGRVIEGWPNTLVLVWGVLLFEGTILTLLISISLAWHRNGGSLRFSMELYSACHQLKNKNYFINSFIIVKWKPGPCIVVSGIFITKKNYLGK